MKHRADALEEAGCSDCQSLNVYQCCFSKLFFSGHHPATKTIFGDKNVFFNLMSSFKLNSW